MSTAAACSDSAPPHPLAAPSTTAGTRGAVGGTPTTDSTVEAEMAIRAATRRYDQAYRDAIANPGNPAKTQPLLVMYTANSPERDRIENLLQTFTRNGWAGRPGGAGHQSIENVKIMNAPPDGLAETTTCTYDDGIVFDAANKAPGGHEIIVNDATQSYRTTWTWVTDAGTWKISDATTVKTWMGADQCAPH
ncbi:hypothetical protein ND748_01080 [Frankia sp. AiPs1]|uniref:hypothetical protein n=1 Tax=Frankia sp. AiPs1 TaxID=573493 RepID=UPI002044BAB6|nr:hypothetical protein [Frankia sp. AiPs1]MCM3920282.1 hypothetical protein [Frankia sp. AiPs1]